MKNAIKLASNVLVKPFEGYHKRLADGTCIAYPDPGTGDKPWTIGWGSTGKDIVPGTIWTEEQASARLEKDLELFAIGVLNLSPEIDKEPERRWAALISFAYNCGLGNYKISTLRRRTNAADWENGAKEFLKWNKAAGREMPGLTRRRKAESLLYI